MSGCVLVISDLHLGGDDKFAICTAEGQRLLAEFLRWVAAQQVKDKNVHLVVNGDSVDFLAEAEFQVFTNDDRAATAKLRRIMNRTAPIWAAFRGVLAAGAQVTFTIGNHDLELSLPGPRRLLLETMGPGHFEFLYDNQALRIGDVLIEHGNRYDRWNSVNHEGLRKARVQISRGLDPPGFEAPAGSHMVIEVMNGLKDKYTFVNLLKPENEAAIPLLAVLDPGAFEKFPAIARLALHATESRRQRDEIAAAVSAASEDSSEYHLDDSQALDVARSLVFGPDPDAMAFEAVTDLLGGLKAKVGAWYRQQQIEKLYQAFRYWLGPQLTTFDTGQENKSYYDAAMNSARAGFRVVVYGHTHLAKRIGLPFGGATYLNTGTWADLMCLPASILLSESAAQARRDLDGFVRDLENNRIDRWTGRLPAFARIEMEEGRAQSAGVYLFEGIDRIAKMPDGRLSRLLVAPEADAGAAGGNS
jgi:UDP-2,3-diacylglucosamine pyrophosphatase LpxH